MGSDDESEVIAHFMEQLREQGLTSRCAWCGRYQVGDRWLPATRIPAFALRARVSDGICPDCVDTLRDSGKSV
jgi:hypothetical protein